MQEKGNNVGTVNSDWPEEIVENMVFIVGSLMDCSTTSKKVTTDKPKSLVMFEYSKLSERKWFWTSWSMILWHD